MHEKANKLCANSGFIPNVSLYLDQLMTSYNFSAMGLGIAFVTDTLVKFGQTRSSTVFYKINDQSAKRELCIGFKCSRYASHAMTGFINISKKYALS